MIDENINEDLEAQDLSQDVLAVDAANQVLVDDEKPRKKRKSRWGGVTGGENVGRLDYKYEDIVDFEKQLQELRTQLKSGTIKFEDLSEKEQEGLKVLDQHLKLKEVVVKPNAKKNLIQDLISSYTPSNIIDELTKPLDFDGKDNSTFSILDYFTEGKLYAPQEQEVVSDGGIFYDPETNTYRKKTLDIGFIEPTLVTDVKTIAKLNTKYNRQASVSPDAQVYASENGRQYVIEGEYWKVKEPKNSFYYYVTDPNLIGKLNTKFGQNLSAPDKTKTKDLALYNTLDRNFANDTYSTFNSSDDINQWVYGGGFGAARFENKIKEFEKKYNIRVEKSKPTLDRFTYGITDALNLTDRTITIVSPNGDRKEFFIDSDGFLDDVQGFVMAKAKPSFNKEYKSKPSKTRSETLGGVLSTVGDLLKENALSIFETGELPQRGLKKEGVTPDYRSVQPTDALYVKPQLPIMFDDDVLGLITPKEYFSSDLIGRKIKQKEEDKKILKQTANQYAQAATNPTLSKFSNIYKTEEFTPGAKTRYIANRLKKESEIIKSQIEDFKKEEEDVSAKLDRIENMKKFIAEQKLAQVEFQNLIDQGKIDPEVAKQRLEERKDFFQRAYGHIDKKYLEEFQVQLADFVKKSEDMSSIADPISSILSNSEKAIGIEMMQRKDQGSFFGGVLKSIVDGALSSLDFGMRVAGVDSENSKKFVDGISSDLLGEGVTKEYEEDANYFYKGVTALTKSMAASATGGRFFGLFGRGYTEMSDQLAPIEGISDEEKIIYSALYGTVSMILEEKGLEEIFKGELGNKVSNYIIKNTISGLGKNATKEVVDAAIINNTKLFLIEMGIKAGVATGSETLTEVAQLTAEYGTKWTINKLHGTDFFNGQLNWQNYAKDLKETVLTTLTGTGAVSIISQSPSVINRGMNALNTKEEREALVAAARATGMDELVVANLRAGLLSGKYSKENAQSILDNFKIVQQKVNTIPKEIPIQEQAVALDLIIERDALNSQIEGVDPALAAPSIERVKEINETLKQIGYAVQESSTESVLQRQQEGIRETGGGREGVEPIVQGQEVAQEGEATAETKAEEVVPVAPTPVPGEKATIADVDIIYPTEPQAEERRGVRSTNEYVEKASESLPVEDVETLAKELEGDFGLLTAENPMAQPLTEEENKKLNEKAVEWLSERGYNPRPVTGKYGQAENSFFVPGLKRQDAIDFAKQFNQEAVAHSDGLVYQDGSMNPRVKENDNFSFKDSYTPDSDFVSIVKTPEGLKTFVVGYNFDEKVMPEQQAAPTQVAQEVTITPETRQTVTERINKETDTKRKKVFTAVQKVLSAIPNARIILHENTDSFVDGVAKSSNKTKEDAKNEGVDTIRGAYVNGDVHINLEKAGVTTVFHEALHDLLTKKGIETNAILDMAKGLKSVISDKALKQRLDEFVSEYTEEIDQNKSKEEIEEAKKEEELTKAEEYIVELGAIMAEAQKELSTTKFQQFKTLVNKIAKKLGLPVVFSAASTAQDAVDFMNSMSSKLGRGEQIEVGKKVGKKVGNTGIKAQGVTIMKGEESMEKYGLKKGKNVTRKIGEALESRQRAKYGKIDQKDNSPEARKKISNWMVDEVKYFIDLMGDKSGKGWYGELYQKSLDAMGKVFPEMKNDQNARDLFTMLVAITSDGQKVMSNFKLAAFAYDYYKKNGSMPKTLPGQRVASFESNLKRINDLLNKYNGDIATIKKDLMEVKSIEEINKERKKEGLEPLSTNWPVSFKAPFAASVFGPKLGMFYSNLSGNEAYPTLDRWWSRTFNRYRGTLIPSLKGGFDKKGEALGLDRFKKILGNPDMSNEEALLASKSYRDSYAAKGYKNGTEIEKAANTIYKIAFENLNDAPFTKNDRQFMYDTVSDAVNKLNKQGYDLSIADVQAILWYFEKNLYKTLGVQAKIEGISYEDAANYTYDKWIESGKKFDYNIKDTEEGQAVEDEDINDNKDQISKIKAQKTEPVAGNKLFNEPLKDAETIAKSYMKSVGMEYVPVEKITKLDENLSKRISDAYDKMKNDPNDPKVKAAYEAMAKETLDQYKAIIDKGYKVEINNTEPYSDSGAMIEDLRDNKRMKIFSTESGFGDEPITDEQRKENPLLRDSGFKDVNGETLLVNDVFRFVHDFFGHAKLGNGFGPIGEENAWRVHSEMYSPEARKAMTSETRGQNSWVNFSGVNDAVFKKRDKARQLRKEGKIEEANQMVGEVYEEMSFADQKVGLLPDFAFEEGRPSKIKAQKPSKQDAIQKAKDKYELSVEKRGNSHQQGVTAAIADLQKSDWYAKADDTQRENAEREIKKFFGEKLKSAPSVAKITGKTKDTAVVSDLAAAIRDQIKLEAKAAREATKDINQRRKELGIAIKNVIKNYKGKISEKQLSAINDRISKVNLLNEEMVDRVIDYVDKVMKDADYKEKINKAKSARATIKKLKKDSNRQAEVRAMATAFASIDPDLVEDIDEYMAIAEQVKNALKPTSLSISNTTKFSDIYSYVDQYLEGQENIKKERLLSNNPSLVEQGIIDKSMSLKDIESKIRRINEQKNKLNKATNSEELKDNLKGEINSLKDILKAMVFGYNPITNERVEMTDRIKQVIKEISSLDVDDMTTEQMIALVESLNNFVKNGTIGGLDAAHKTYVGIKNANDLKRKGFVARQLKAYFSPMLGRLLGFEGMSLNELFTRLFGGVTRGNEFMEKSGVAGVVMGVNKAKKMSNAYQELYANTFKNIKGFFDQENVYERGVLAFVSRTNSIKPEEANKEFNRRIDLLLESYESLKNGTAEEQKMAEVYKKVFDRLNIESRDMSVIESNAKQFNIAGAAWWMGTWENHYQDLYDVSLSIYNTDLGSDFYYTSDRLSKLSESTGESIDITNISERGSSFLINTENEEITDKSKAGVLIASTYPKTLKDKGRYVNLNFDINQSQALSGALVDIETAGAIRQVDAFISSDSFKSIIPSSSDRSLVVNRINKYIRRSKNKLLVPKDYARVIDKVINEAGRFGTTMALGGVFQFILQTFSVGINTLIQAGKNTQLYTGKSFNDWMNSTGTPTANRGVESVTSIENKMNAIDPVKSTLQQVARQYQKLTQFYMKTFLSKPDVFVARAAWKSYYLKYLSDNGYDTKKINWDTWNDTIKEEGIQDLHEKAMLFAENMVSRQQNVSDERLAGETFSSEDGLRKAVRKILLPFAGFSVNQRMRLANDIITLTSARNVASKEDIEIAGRSLAGTVAEQATFNFIKYQVGKLIYYGAMSILGYGDDDEDEEEAKKRNRNALKYPIKSFIGDMASPAPFLDDFMVWAIDKGIKPFMEPSESEINDAVNEENNIRNIALGKYEMTEDEKEEFIKKYKEDNTFSLESFKNDTGKYGLISVGSDAYEALYESLKMNDGKYTEEFQGKETEKYLTKDQIESQKIFSALKLFHFIGVLPREANQLADKGTRKIKQNSLTKNQYESYKEFKKEFKREPKPYEIDIIKSTPYVIKEGYTEGSNQKMLENIYNIDQLGGLSNQQGKVYAKLMSTGIEVTPQVYKLIQKGKTVEQIRKFIISN